MFHEALDFLAFALSVIAWGIILVACVYAIGRGGRD